MFDDDFESCIDKTEDDLKTKWSSYSILTTQNRKIVLPPMLKKRTGAFLQGTKDQLHMGRDTANTVLQISDLPNILKQYHTHGDWLGKAAYKAKN